MNAKELVLFQLKNLYGIGDLELVSLNTEQLFDEAETFAFQSISGFYNKYNTGEINPYNGVMYTNYLYWLSRLFYESGKEEIASKVYGLNKMLHSVDLFYAIELPPIWSCEHPLGAVMGRAKYGNRFFFYQGCTVGGNIHKGHLEYPIIGEDVKMYSDSKILGKCIIGNNVTLAANAYVINQDIPDNCIVFGQSPNIVIKRKMDVKT